jgi:glycosyltransferase involved in cell wall biosynthesis
MSRAGKLSIIIPFYNEESNLPKLHTELTEVIKDLRIPTEILYIDDGSTDKSVEHLTKATKKVGKKNTTKIKIIKFRKNFGQTAAIAAGIDNATGNLISFLDADLQNDPHDIPRFLDKLNEGYDAVFGWRKDRKDASLRSHLSRSANKLISKVFAYPYHDVGCSARVVKKEFIDGLNLYGELHRVIPVLIYLKGAKIGEIVVKHRSRASGVSKYGFNRIIKTLIDIITVKFLNSYGTRPAYIFGTFGLASISLSAVAVLISAYKKLFLGVFVHRDPVFLLAIFFGMVGIQFLLMGILAEIQVRTYFESQNKAIYDLKEVEIY